MVRGPRNPGGSFAYFAGVASQRPKITHKLIVFYSMMKALYELELLPSSQSFSLSKVPLFSIFKIASPKFCFCLFEHEYTEFLNFVVLWFLLLYSEVSPFLFSTLAFERQWTPLVGRPHWTT